MVDVNCLFNFEEVNYRLVIPTKNENQVIGYDELRKALSSHPKLKDTDFFDEEKYVVEIFDKGFEEYIKLSKNAPIPNYTKLRSRLRPKMSYKAMTKQSGDSLKRPLLMFAENSLEEEQATKILRGSPPRERVPVKRGRSPQPPSSASHHSARSTPSTPNKTPSGLSENSRNVSYGSGGKYQSGSLPYNQQTPRGRSPPRSVNEPPPRQQPPPRLQTPQTRLQTPQARLQTPQARLQTPQARPQTSQIQPPRQQSTPTMSQVTQQPKPTPRPQMETPSKPLPQRQLPLPSDLYHKSTKSMIDETLSAGQRKRLEVLKAQYKILNLAEKYALIRAVTKYNEEFIAIMLFEDIWETDSVWNFVWREMTSQGVKEIKDVKAARKMFKSLVDQYVALLKLTDLTPREAQEIWPLFDSFHFKMDVRPFCKKIKDIKDAFDNGDKTKPFERLEDPFSIQDTLECTSLDFRLLLSVEDHNKEFSNETVPEYSAWREVTDQINLYKPYEPSLITKYKTRFYQLFKEFLRIEKADITDDEKAKWKLYTSFKNLDLEPFLSKVDQN